MSIDVFNTIVFDDRGMGYVEESNTLYPSYKNEPVCEMHLMVTSK